MAKLVRTANENQQTKKATIALQESRPPCLKILSLLSIVETIVVRTILCLTSRKILLISTLWGFHLTYIYCTNQYMGIPFFIVFHLSQTEKKCFSIFLSYKDFPLKTVKQKSYKVFMFKYLKGRNCLGNLFLRFVTSKMLYFVEEIFAVLLNFAELIFAIERFWYYFFEIFLQYFRDQPKEGLQR